jgi:hypothetical protein
VTPTAGANVLLLAAGADTSGIVTNTPTGGWTALNTSGVVATVGFGYLVIPSASGSYSTTWPDSVSYGQWATLIAGWDGSGGGGGGGSVLSGFYYRQFVGGIR